MRLATWNIYWLGSDAKLLRTDADLARIAALLRSFDADVLVLQEIVSLGVLRDLFARVEALGGRGYSFDDGRGEPLASAKESSPEQKIVLAYDRARLVVEASTRVGRVKGRKPVAARLRTLADGARRLVVGVHLQSGYPVFTDPADSADRARQCDALAAWLAGRAAAEHPRLRSPEAGEPVIVAGDFNAPWESDEPDFAGLVASLDALRTLPGYRWLRPDEDPRGGGLVTSYVDQVAIDHVVVSASVVTPTAPRLVAFDQEGAVAGVDPERVSDHRPVRIELG